MADSDCDINQHANLQIRWRQDRGLRESYSGFVRGVRVLRVYRADEAHDKSTWHVGGSAVMPCFRVYSGKLSYVEARNRAQVWWSKHASRQYEQLRRLVGHGRS